jgi:hypothetical protein
MEASERKLPCKYSLLWGFLSVMVYPVESDEQTSERCA